jgi:hypothetical protein
MVAQTKTAEPTVVNGINVDDLFALIEGVRRDTATGKTNWRVTTTWQGQTRSRAQVDSFEIGTKEEFAEIHNAVMATSPNFYNVSRPVDLKPTLVIE